MWLPSLLLVAACSGAAASGHTQADSGHSALSRGSVSVAGETVRYIRYLPTTLLHAPTLLLIHAAGGGADRMVASWRELAEVEGVVLIAPELSLTAEQETRVVELLPAIVDAACSALDVDRSRSYVFGYSAGGYFAFEAATLLSTRFAAVAVFASSIAPEYAAIVERATRKTPIAIYLGDRDRFFALAQGRATRDLLVGHGFPVRYVELPGQDHDYARVAAVINADAWRFLDSFELPKRR